MPQDTLLSVLVQSLGAGLQGAGQASREKAAGDKQAALQTFTAGLQLEQQRMAQEQHKEAMIRGAGELKLQNLKTQQAQFKLDALANPLKADTDFLLNRIGEAPLAPELSILQGLGTPSALGAIGDFNLSPISRQQGIGAIREQLQPGETSELPSGQVISGGKSFTPGRPTDFDKKLFLIGRDAMIKIITKEGGLTQRDKEKFYLDYKARQQKDIANQLPGFEKEIKILTFNEWLIEAGLPTLNEKSTTGSTVQSDEDIENRIRELEGQ